MVFLLLLETRISIVAAAACVARVFSYHPHRDHMATTGTPRDLPSLDKGKSYRNKQDLLRAIRLDSVSQDRSTFTQSSNSRYLRVICWTLKGKNKAERGRETACKFHVRASVRSTSDSQHPAGNPRPPEWRITHSSLIHTCTKPMEGAPRKRRHHLIAQDLGDLALQVVKEDSRKGALAKRLRQLLKEQGLNHVSESQVCVLCC